MKNHKSLWLAAVVALAFGSASASAAPQKAAAQKTTVAKTTIAQPRPVKLTLPNGLTALVLENRAAPVVAVRVYVKTGSIYEGEYLGAGISHLFEHTLSEGTTTRTKEQINQEVQAIGGQSNAYTTTDLTAYHITTASSFFGRALNSLADMMQNATFPDAEVKKQIGIIHNEMNLGEDDPDRVIYKLFYNTAFRVHPVRFPVIGYREPFDRLTQTDIVNYYKTHYTPENTVVSVAGDVSTQDALQQISQAFGSWSRRTPQTPTLPEEPRQTSPRRAEVQKDISQTYMMMGWHTIPLQHPDLYALDTLAEILGGSESARLVRELRERRNLVTRVGAWSSTPNYNAGAFIINAVMPPKNAGQIESAVWQQIERIKNGGVTADELARAKRQIETGFVFGNTEVENQAEQIAYDYLGTGDPEFSRQYVARIQSVTAAQVQNMARKYLTREGITTVWVKPRSASNASTQNTSTVANTTKTVATKPQMFRLSNGVRLIVRENHASPTVAFAAYALGGARLEPANKAGVSSAMADMLTRGTTRRNADEIAALIDDLGGALNGFSGYNSWGITSRWLARDWRRGLALTAESLLQPTFPNDELQRVKQQQLARIAEQQDDPLSAASLLMRKTYFGNHPYARPSAGTSETVSSINRDDVLQFWRRALQPQNLVISVYGDVNTGEVRRAVEYSLGRFKATGAPLPAPPQVSPLSQFNFQENRKPGLAQAVLVYGFPGIDVKDEDRYAIDVLDAAMSGSNLPGGRLHARLRDNQLVYAVHAYNSPGLEPGAFVIYAATTQQNVERVRGIIDEEVQRVRNEPISVEELARAKTMTIAARAIDLQTNMSQAQEAASDELFGLGYNEGESYEQRINAVTLEEVQRVAQKYLRPEGAALALVGPAQAATSGE
jgi:zinc protease